MKYWRIIMFLVVTGAATLSFYLFPFLSQRNIPFLESSVEAGKVLVISDLHLENNYRDLSCIGDFLKKNDVASLVINGDSYDMKQEKKLNDKLINSLKERLKIKDARLENLFYILSLYDHDPLFQEEKSDGNGEINIVKGVLKLGIGSQLFYILHGDYFAKDGGTPYLINRLGINLLYERLTKMILRAQDKDWLILGHSHLPGIDNENKVANSGNWINRVLDASDTGVLLTPGEFGCEVSLIKIPCED